MPSYFSAYFLLLFRKSLKSAIKYGITYGMTISIPMLASASVYFVGGKLVKSGEVPFDGVFK